MDEPDTAAIVDPDPDSATDRETSLVDSFGHRDETRLKPPFSCSQPVSVEPVLFLSMFSLTLLAPLSTQYLWDRISEDLGYNGSERSECNSSLPPDPLQKEVQTLTAHWNMYINLGGFSLGLLVVPLLGSWSDQAGRRPVLIIPNVGLALQSVVYLVVMYLKLPVGYLLLGRMLSGILGDFNAILAGCFAYIADISDRRSRTFRVAILEACLGLSGMMASIIGGQWRKAQGYINPIWLVLATCLASALYSYLFVPESVLPDPSARLLTIRHHKAVWQLYSTGYGLSFLFMAATPVIRSKLSKLVDPSDQGVLFASIACVESLCFLVGSSVFNSLFPATLHFMKGFPFLFAAIILLIPAGIICTLQCLEQRRDHRDSAVS